MSYLILDLATTGIDNAAEFISTDDIAAPANYKDPEKIAAYCEAKRAERIAEAALDVDLARITAIGLASPRWGNAINIDICRTEDDERAALETIRREALSARSSYEWAMPLVSFNGLRYDWPLLMRRAFYLGVDFPAISLDRYRTNHIDVWDRLSHHGVLKAHSLTWYAKRLGWTDLVKPLSGAEEAQAAKDGKWDELRASVEHDVRACQRLAAHAKWIQAPVLEPVI